MNPLSHIGVEWDQLRRRLTQRILRHRVLYRNPTLLCDPSAIWDYGYHDIGQILLGENVSVGAFAEIIVHKKNRNSTIEGSLTVGNNVVISAGANIRAAGGPITIGDGSGIGQYSVVVSGTHTIKPGTARFNTPFDESRSGVTIGRNVWVAAHCVVLPGVTIGDDAVIAAGSIVGTDVPAGEIWGGAPARKQMTVEAFGRFRR